MVQLPMTSPHDDDPDAPEPPVDRSLPESKDGPGFKDGEEAPFGSTLHYVQKAQAGGDEVTWANLHAKIVQWVEEATSGTNFPPHKNLDDLTQDVCMQVYRDLDHFAVEPGASFSGWVREIAHRKLTDWWRRERAQKRGGHRVRVQPTGPDGGEDRGMDEFADESSARQSMYARYTELTKGLEAALGRLSDKHRRVLEMRLFQRMSFAEIAPRLGYTKEVTVRSLHFRALQRLQELLAEFG